VAKFAVKKYDIENGPATTTLYKFFYEINIFFHYLDKMKIQDLSKVTPLICTNYVSDVHKVSVGRSQGGLAVSTKQGWFLAIEQLHRLISATPWAFEHPWPESTSHILAGGYKEIGKRIAKTKAINDSELKTLIQYCDKVIKEAEGLIKLRSDIELTHNKLKKHYNKSVISRDVNSHIYKTINKEIVSTYLQPNGYSNLHEFNNKLYEIPKAVSIIVLAFSGVRSHELCAIQSDFYRKEDNEDTMYYWLKSHSSKTYEGYTEWLVPQIVIKALAIQNSYIKPQQEELKREQKILFKQNPHSQRAIDIESFKNHLFLTENEISIQPITNESLQKHTVTLGKKVGINKISPQRFRRTFAIYVAQSNYGDLRYLKKHFKHWSMDMTLLYSFNDAQSVELYDEIAIEIKNYKIARVEEFLDEDTIITGGLSGNLISLRSSNEMIKTFKNRTEMVEKISDSVHLRSTGHSWCTSDIAGCGARSAIEGTACVDCKESIIEKNRHGEFFKGVYLQQLELREIDDIGIAGQQRVKRDIERCERVLKELGLFDLVSCEVEKQGLKA
jgi:integrase